MVNGVGVQVKAGELRLLVSYVCRGSAHGVAYAAQLSGATSGPPAPAMETKDYVQGTWPQSVSES